MLIAEGHRSQREDRFARLVHRLDLGFETLREAAELFTVVFYGSTIFCCKTAQFCARQRESDMSKTPSVRNAAQAGENERKKPPLNYESPALTAELQAHLRT
jgi:hypothetical protein